MKVDGLAAEEAQDRAIPETHGGASEVEGLLVPPIIHGLGVEEGVEAAVEAEVDGMAVEEAPVLVIRMIHGGGMGMEEGQQETMVVITDGMADKEAGEMEVDSDKWEDVVMEQSVTMDTVVVGRSHGAIRRTS